MVRRGSSQLLTAAACLFGAACGGGTEPAPSTVAVTVAPAPTVPDEVEAGTAAFVLGREPFELDVADCALEAVVDAGTGITTELSATATGPDGVVVRVVRSSFVADLPTVTDTITFSIEGGGGVVAESERVDAAGRILDLRDDGATGRLIDLDGDVIRATGVFGPPGARGPEPTDVEGTLVLRCPPP